MTRVGRSWNSPAVANGPWILLSDDSLGPWIPCLLPSISCRYSWSLQSARANYKIAIRRRDRHVWLQSLKKVLIWPKNFFFDKKSQKGSKKRRISRWFRIRCKSCRKIHTKKVISKTSLTNISKSEKSAFFHHIFANNFFLVHVFKTFSMDSKSVWNSVFFWHLFRFFSEKFFLGHISTFFQLWLQKRRKRLKKQKIFFYKCILEFNYATIKGFA